MINMSLSPEITKSILTFEIFYSVHSVKAVCSNLKMEMGIFSICYMHNMLKILFITIRVLSFLLIACAVNTDGHTVRFSMFGF